MDQKFSDFTPEFWQAALRKRVLVFGVEDEELYRRAVKAYTAPGGVYEEYFNISKPPPRLIVYAGNELPDGISTIDEHGQFHIPIGGNDDVARALIWHAYNAPYKSVDPEERTSEGVRITATKQERKEQDRGKDRPSRGSFAINRSRDHLEILLPLDHSKGFSNTWGQLLDWAEFKRESPDAWQIFLNNRFSDEVLAQYSGTANFTRPNGAEVQDFPLSRDWLRSLRVMNGLSTPYMTRLLEMPSFNSYSNIENAVYEFSVERANTILSSNPFCLPEVEDESGNRSVDFTYAKKFARMAGHQYYFPEEVKPQLFSAVKAVAKAYLQGEITSEEMPSLNELMVILSRDRLRNILGSKGTQLREDIIAGHPFLSKTSALYQLNGADFSPYFAAMPYYSKRKEENVASSALTPPQAFELAANTATGLGNFLKIYRESIGKSLEDVGKAILVTKEAIRQIEGKISIAWETVDKILSAKNPYDLPTDVERNIQIDVAAFIREIHIPSRSWGRISKKEQQMIDQKAADEGKWLTFVDVARELFDTEAYLINDSTYKRNGLHTKIHFNPEYIILRAVWDEVIVAHAKSIQPWQEDVLKIGGAEVRYKRGTDSEYRLHADGLQALRTAMLLTRDSIRK